MDTNPKAQTPVGTARQPVVGMEPGGTDGSGLSAFEGTGSGDMGHQKRRWEVTAGSECEIGLQDVAAGGDSENVSQTRVPGDISAWGTRVLFRRRTALRQELALPVKIAYFLHQLDQFGDHRVDRLTPEYCVIPNLMQGWMNVQLLQQPAIHERLEIPLL